MDTRAIARASIHDLPSAGGGRREQELLAFPQAGDHLRVLVADGPDLERSRDRLAALAPEIDAGARPVAPHSGRRHAQHVVHRLDPDDGVPAGAIASTVAGARRSGTASTLTSTCWFTAMRAASDSSNGTTSWKESMLFNTMNALLPAAAPPPDSPLALSSLLSG